MKFKGTLILLVSQDVIFKPFFVSNLIDILNKEKIKVSKIIEVASKNISTKKSNSLNYQTWSKVAIIQFGCIFLAKKIISTLPIPLFLKYKSTVKLVAKRNCIPYKFIFNLNEYLANTNLNKNDLIFSFQHQIIKNPDSHKAFFINCHPGDLSKYRGIKPIFWAMLDKKVKGEISIHFIDSGIDTGTLILKKSFVLNKSLGDNYYKAYKLSSLIASDAIKNFKPEEKIIPSNSKINATSYKSHPNKIDIEKFYSSGLITRLSFINFISLLKTF